MFQAFSANLTFLIAVSALKGGKGGFVDIFLLLLTNSSNLYAHNLFNGGCKEHCWQKVKVISNKNKLKKIDNQINIESKNSCLNKSICRG